MAGIETKAPADPAGPSPLRRPGSIRRTSSIETHWPEGPGRPMRMRGRARDLFTPDGGAEPRVLAEDWTDILASFHREILEIETSHGAQAARELVGARAGGKLRGELARLFPEDLAQASPLHLLLDDFAGASLVAGWGWSRWPGEAMAKLRAESAKNAGRGGRMEGVCAGFRPGASSLTAEGGPNHEHQSSAAVPPLPHPEDPAGWHELTAQTGVGMRRARRLDVWLDGAVRLDIHFQDSGTTPQGEGREAIHEYRVFATADPETFELLTLEVQPRVLPYWECRAASPNASMMLGVRLGDLRETVLKTLPGTLGCTHLNDVLRSMADVPSLVARLRALGA